MIRRDIAICLRTLRGRSITVLSGLALLAASSAAAAAVPNLNSSPAVDADAWLLMAVRSGEVLDSHQPNQPLPPGSLAKLMTAYLTFEAIAKDWIEPSDDVRVSEHEWRMSGSQMFLEVGERVTIDQLLQGMLVAGGNDAAHALARHIGPGVPQFVARMNRKARALGMEHTHFTNPSGLPEPEQQTTARDLALLARALIRDFPQQHRRFSDAAITHSGITQSNRNSLLGLIPGADGLITGSTESHGYNLAASATREDLQLVGIVLGANSEDDRLLGAAANLRYGFENFETVRLRSANAPVDQARVWKGQSDFVPAVLAEPLDVTVRSRAVGSLDARIHFRNTIVAPVAQGDRIGWLEVDTDAGTVVRRPLLAAHRVDTAGWFDYAIDTVKLRWDRFWREQRQSLFAGDPNEAPSDTSG